MKIPLIILFLLLILFLVLIAVCVYLRARIMLLRRRLKTSMHNSIEISNFLSLFSRNLKTKAEFDNWMNVTARYVAELVEAQSVCIFLREGDSMLRADGLTGPFPLLHKASTNYVMTKPKYILEQLAGACDVREGIIGTVAQTNQEIVIEDAVHDDRWCGGSAGADECLMAVPLVNEGVVTGVMCASQQ